MYSKVEIIIIVISELLGLASIPINEIMIRYLKNKPPGMQTFLDRILVDTHRSYQILSFVLHVIFSLALCLAPFHQILGKICMLFSHFYTLKYFFCSEKRKVRGQKAINF